MSHNSSTAPDIELFSTALESQRPSVKGKFIYIGDEKFYVRGVTYGTFRPDADGFEFTDPKVVKKDFDLMSSCGINAIRTYTVPPEWVLDLALERALRVMIGIPWEQHITFIDDNNLVKDIEKRISSGVSSCAGHPAVLCYAIGNEIPASIVRWHGPKTIERFLKKLYDCAKEADPAGLVTYVNFPTTEYLQLPFIDLFCFNVYLESQESLKTYLYRLQNISGEKPLLMTELGLDSRRNGLENQSKSLGWQIQTSFTSGCAGVFVFSWTDEWHRGGYDIEDWDFGLTTRDRLPKPSLASTRKAYAEVPFGNTVNWPRISVIVCTYNGHNSIGECLNGLTRLEYPEYEVIVVNDGSNEETSTIINELGNKYGFKVITTDKNGLSAARNTGIEAASGELVAFIDDDAYPDSRWLQYLAYEFKRTNHAGIGGPNLPPQSDGDIAKCISEAPGNPSHVMISDLEAEHIPGCNMAFRRDALLAVGGFDPQFKIAGDDVDICWRLKEKGWILGYSPSAVVYHHRRNSLRSFWKQQLNYGKAEALLEKKWPEKYNVYGNCRWSGKLYGKGFTKALGLSNSRIYHGVWGSAPFQSIYQTTPGVLQSLLLMPEWYFIIFALSALSCLGFLWKPLLFSFPILGIALGIPIIQSAKNSLGIQISRQHRSHFQIARMHAIIATLYFIQPLARLFGRSGYGLTPWRRRKLHKLSLPWPRNYSIWSETWQPHDKRLESIEQELLKQGCIVTRGGEYDPWDLEVRLGLFGSLRIRTAVEEHAGGKQMIRLRSYPKIPRFGFALFLLFTILATLAGIDGAWHVFLILGGIAVITGVRLIGDCAVATNSYLKVIKEKKDANA